MDALPMAKGGCLPKPKREHVLTSPPSRAILGLLDTLVDIGVFAEKEVIQ